MFGLTFLPLKLHQFSKVHLLRDFKSAFQIGERYELEKFELSQLRSGLSGDHTLCWRTPFSS